MGRYRGREDDGIDLASRGVIDLGDVFVVPQLLSDEMLSQAQLEASRRAVYPDVNATINVNTSDPEQILVNALLMSAPPGVPQAPLLDPAFSQNGDRSSCTFGELGRDTRGMDVLQRTEEIRIDANPDLPLPVSYQMVANWRRECEKRGIAPEIAGIDSSHSHTCSCANPCAPTNAHESIRPESWAWDTRSVINRRWSPGRTPCRFSPPSPAPI